MADRLGIPPGGGAFRVGNQVRPIPVPMGGGGGGMRPTVPVQTSPVINRPSGSIIAPPRASPVITSPAATRLTGVRTQPSTSIISPGTGIQRPGGVITTPGVGGGTQLGSSNGMTVVRPGIVNPGTVGVPSGNTGGPISRPGGAIARPVVPSVPVYGPQQSQPSFWNSVVPTLSAGPEGITVGAQGVLPNGMTVGGAVTRTPDGQIVGAVNGQGPAGYVVPQGAGGYSQQYPGYNGQIGQVPGVNNVPLSSTTSFSAGGTCLPASNGIFGFFENTIGAGVRKLMGNDGRQLGCGIATNPNAGAGWTQGTPRGVPSTGYNSQLPNRSGGVPIGSPGGIVTGRPSPSVMYGN